MTDLAGRMDFLVWLVVWVSLALMVGALADRWNRTGLLWACAALLVSPLLALACLLVLGNAMPLCPACKGHVPAGATACRHCGRDLSAPPVDVS